MNKWKKTNVQKFYIQNPHDKGFLIQPELGFRGRDNIKTTQLS